MQDKINVYWFKRDLRLHDNEALSRALSSRYPCLCIYIFEDMLYHNPHYSLRHFNFIKQSLNELNRELVAYRTRILILHAECLAFFKQLLERVQIHEVFSHQETGLDCTYKRDLNLSMFFNTKNITWTETQNNGVKRYQKDRKHWQKNWESYMSAPQIKLKLEPRGFLSHASIDALGFKEVETTTSNSPYFQPGGRSYGLKYAKSFFTDRILNYNTHISKPELSRQSCSRLSPYIAWGNLSIREIVQKASLIKVDKTKVNGQKVGRQIGAIASRLRWQSHFIQKFEQECRMEFEPVNKAYVDLFPVNERYIKAWKNAETGYPLIDASMRCVVKTGYLNFRMRACLASFFCHHLFQGFWHGSAFLAAQFLDFEPGIHYPQFNMQAGVTGINTIRVYNPVLNAQKHDEKASFIKKWLPELQHLPTNFASQPWAMTALEQKFSNFELGKDYPKPIVDIKRTRQHALDRLYGLRKQKLTKSESRRILHSHTNPNRTSS